MLFPELGDELLDRLAREFRLGGGQLVLRAEQACGDGGRALLAA